MTIIKKIYLSSPFTAQLWTWKSNKPSSQPTIWHHFLISNLWDRFCWNIQIVSGNVISISPRNLMRVSSSDRQFGSAFHYIMNSLKYSFPSSFSDLPLACQRALEAMSNELNSMDPGFHDTSDHSNTPKKKTIASIKWGRSEFRLLLLLLSCVCSKESCKWNLFYFFGAMPDDTTESVATHSLSSITLHAPVTTFIP